MVEGGEHEVFEICISELLLLLLAVERTWQSLACSKRWAISLVWPALSVLLSSECFLYLLVCLSNGS